MATELNILGRIPPQNIEAEQSVLGSMLLDKEAIPVAAEILKMTISIEKTMEKYMKL